LPPGHRKRLLTPTETLSTFLAQPLSAEELDWQDADVVLARVRRRILRAFVWRGLLEKDDRKEMQQWNHGRGFSLDATVRVAANDRHGLGRLLPCSARGPFATERLEELHQHRPI
jgi:hypothetical protein